MTHRITISLAEVDEAFLQTLKAKYPAHARLDIQIVDLDAIPTFTDEDFWQIIARLDWSAEGNRQAVLAPAVAALAQRPVSHIYLFEDRLAEMLYQLDTRAHARVAYPGDLFSEDGFLYVRAAVVARGKAHFHAVLHDPAQLDPEDDFEPLLSLAALAFERKAGEEFDYTAPLSYETGTNEAGW